MSNIKATLYNVILLGLLFPFLCVVNYSLLSDWGLSDVSRDIGIISGASFLFIFFGMVYLGIFLKVLKSIISEDPNTKEAHVKIYSAGIVYSWLVLCSAPFPILFVLWAQTASDISGNILGVFLICLNLLPAVIIFGFIFSFLNLLFLKKKDA